jgi:hypothetical protein
VVKSTGASRTAASRVSHRSPRVHWQNRTPASQYQDTKFQKSSAGKEMLAPPAGSLPLPRWAWGPLSVPCRPGTPAYKFQVKTKGEACKSHAPACPQPQHEPHSPGQLRGHHVSYGSSSRCPAWGSSGAAACPTAPAPAAQPGAAPGPPHVP